jgi:four helix bundle protein
MSSAADDLRFYCVRSPSCDSCGHFAFLRRASDLLECGGMAGLRDVTEFDAYKLADALRRRIRPILTRPGFRLDRRLHEQLDAAVEGPCPDLSEGFSRYHPRDFARFVRIAKASISEVITHLGVALDKDLVTQGEHDELVRLAKRARGATTGLIRYLEGATAPHVPRTQPRRHRHPRG